MEEARQKRAGAKDGRRRHTGNAPDGGALTSTVATTAGEERRHCAHGAMINKGRALDNAVLGKEGN